MKNKNFKFIDLFAGIGGFHQSMYELGGECVFASEIDLNARKTYEHNFSKHSPNLFSNGLFNKDIKTIMPEEIPNFDVLCAGFPCQPFSQAGKKYGFEDNHKSERGNLFFDIAEIIKVKRPKAFFLENVRGLVKHDNGNTFKTIQHILTEELGYSFYHQIVKASDYGLPQLRPRAFMIGFRDEELLQGFNFPPKIPLKFNMSDVWGGECSREIGFTVRVGGRGSKIDDRRNWDAYLVNGEVRRLSFKEAQKIQGFPDDYHFPVSATQAMKQLGNSVAIDAVKCVGHNLIEYMNNLDNKGKQMKKTNNKGEWTELYTFIKILLEQRLVLSDKDLNPTGEYFKVNKVTTENLELDFIPLSEFSIKSVNRNTKEEVEIGISEIINSDTLANILNKIKTGRGTFEINDFEVIQTSLGFSVVKGGTSSQKADIVLGIEHHSFIKENESFGIKSYLGNKLTLLNASGNTNFMFEIVNLDNNKITEINSISTRTKLKDRIESIITNGGVFNYLKAEKDTMNYNLKMVDNILPNIIGYLLMTFYGNRVSKISNIVDYLCDNTDILNELDIDDKEMLINKLKKFLVDILLGFFAGSKWDGSYESNGTIVVKENGSLVTFHIIDMESLKDYLYENIRLDTPSSSRHKFGTIIQDKTKNYLKLNLQLRF
ncbi:MAG: DNA-cytosine methyltransferase (EC [uncultured Sulfurovum sp.]|uniref:Cytosine-specific methyltransferase n=1 Tax=uncultured Sulfurovum sp. TaxID=269237 RepID=A0A6S6SAD2_9BACT|nr:MAG: DNA-cytosine methyltransferase (EC [uncultured Sulfurovum sp.]